MLRGSVPGKLADGTKTRTKGVLTLLGVVTRLTAVLASKLVRAKLSAYEEINGVDEVGQSV